MPLRMNAIGRRSVRETRTTPESYVGRVLRLTLLAPDIVEAILGGRQPARLQLDGLMKRFPVGWREQQTMFLHPLRTSDITRVFDREPL